MQLVFDGELVAGFAADEVRLAVAQHFNLGNAQLDAMFSGREVVLRRNLDADEAVRYIRYLATLGMRVRSRPMPDAPATTRSGSLLGTLTGSLPPAAPSPPRWHPAPEPDTIPIEPMVTLRPSPASASSLTPTQAPAAWSAAPDTMPLSPSRDDATGSGAEQEAACLRCGEVQPKRLLCRNCGAKLPDPADFDDDDPVSASLPLTEPPHDTAPGTRPGGEPSRRSDFAESQASGPASRSGARSGSRRRSRTGAQAQGDAATSSAPALWAWGWSGRLGRVNFATGVFALTALMSLVAIVTSWMPITARSLVNLAVLMPALVMSLRQAALRLHDVGRSAWWLLSLLLPAATVVVGVIAPLLGVMAFGVAAIALLVAGLLLLFWPGNDGGNAYGEPPRAGNVPLLVGSIIAALVLGALAPTDMPRPGGPMRAPGGETPRSDAPRSDAPGTGAQRTDAPRTDAPRTDAPRADTPRVETPRSEAPRAPAAPAETPRVDGARPDVPRSPAAAPATGDVMARLKSIDARRAYVNDYAPAAGPKAFAASSSGSWGWKSEATSIDEASTEALATCNRYRKPTEAVCEIVNAKPTR